jgi:hypothetical protein
LSVAVDAPFPTVIGLPDPTLSRIFLFVTSGSPVTVTVVPLQLTEAVGVALVPPAPINALVEFILTPVVVALQVVRTKSDVLIAVLSPNITESFTAMSGLYEPTVEFGSILIPTPPDSESLNALVADAPVPTTTDVTLFIDVCDSLVEKTNVGRPDVAILISTEPPMLLLPINISVPPPVIEDAIVVGNSYLPNASILKTNALRVDVNGVYDRAVDVVSNRSDF